MHSQGVPLRTLITTPLKAFTVVPNAALAALCNHDSFSQYMLQRQKDPREWDTHLFPGLRGLDPESAFGEVVWAVLGGRTHPAVLIVILCYVRVQVWQDLYFVSAVQGSDQSLIFLVWFVLYS